MAVGFFFVSKKRFDILLETHDCVRRQLGLISSRLRDNRGPARHVYLVRISRAEKSTIRFVIPSVRTAVPRRTRCNGTVCTCSDPMYRNRMQNGVLIVFSVIAVIANYTYLNVFL